MNPILRHFNKKIGVSHHVYITDKGHRGQCGRIVQVSDLQSEYFGEGQMDLLQVVSSLSPDIILITGDIADRSHTDLKAAEVATEGLVGIAPAFYVNGNHEADLISETANWIYDMLRKHGVKVLLDCHTRTELGGIPLKIAGYSSYALFKARGQQVGTGEKQHKTGLDSEMLIEQCKFALDDENRDGGEAGLNSNYGGEKSLVKEGTEEKQNRRPNSGADENKYESKYNEELSILMAHEPQYLKYYAEAEPDLIFSGHAHGGQICLPGKQGIFAPGQGLFPKLTTGEHKCGNSTMYISRGLGNSSFPLRVNNPPEIVCVDVKCQRADVNGKSSAVNWKC